MQDFNREAITKPKPKGEKCCINLPDLHQLWHKQQLETEERRTRNKMQLCKKIAAFLETINGKGREGRVHIMIGLFDKNEGFIILLMWVCILSVLFLNDMSPISMQSLLKRQVTHTNHILTRV